MNNRLTEIVFILDRSGSMAGLEKDTIGGFNSLIAKQKKEEGKTFVSAVLFNTEPVVLYDRIPLEEVPKMTEKEYETFGGTALLDAVGGAIHHIKNVHRYSKQEDRPQKTLFVITTDGMENSSQYYTYAKVKEMIEQQRKRADWEFLFLGANIDAAEEAARVGIDSDHAARFCCDSKGTALNYDVLNSAVQNVRRGKSIDRSWKKDIDADFRKRGR